MTNTSLLLLKNHRPRLASECSGVLLTTAVYKRARWFLLLSAIVALAGCAGVRGHTRAKARPRPAVEHQQPKLDDLDVLIGREIWRR